LELDTTINDTLTKAREASAKSSMDVEEEGALVERIATVFKGTRHQPFEIANEQRAGGKHNKKQKEVMSSSTTLFLSLNHAEEQTRLAAIQQLEAIIEGDDAAADVCVMLFLPSTTTLICAHTFSYSFSCSSFMPSHYLRASLLTTQNWYWMLFSKQGINLRALRNYNLNNNSGRDSMPSSFDN
jgi:spore maturation protein SpmA